MKKIKLFEEFQMNDMVSEIHRIHGGQLTEDRINELINEGFFDWIKGLFMNPMKKRKLRQLADRLVDVRVELGTIQIEQEQLEEIQSDAEQSEEEDEYVYTANSSSRSSRSSSSSPNKGSAAFQLKENSLKSMEDDIISNMDALGEENETLKKYVSTVKLESRMKSTEMLIGIANSEVKRILKKSLNKDKKTVSLLNIDIKSELED